MAAADLDQLSIDTIRTLSMDAIQKANSGHPGLPLGMAPAAFLLYAEVMKHDPQDPDWPDRDRFVLSAGHGSMLQYAALHLAGYDLTVEDLQQFRQWDSRTPGHPERERREDGSWRTPGVEVTTGPLGQGFANGVGLAMAEKFLRETFGSEVQDHFTYAIVSDGDLMEGIASEAASLAGHLGLGKLVYLYDDNDISLDGPTSLSFDEDTTARFESYGWHVQTVEDANDLAALRAAIAAAQAETAKPSLIRVKSIIGYPAPNKQGTSGAHGAPLGEDEIRATKEIMGWDPDAQFLVPDGVLEHAGAAGRKGAEERAAWEQRLEAMKAADADKAAAWDAGWSCRPLPGLAEVLPGDAEAFGKPKLATRAAGKAVMAAFAGHVPTMVGGAADLSGSTATIFPGGDDERFTKDQVGRNVYWGVREHAMGGAVNGLAAHGGIVRPYGSTFLQFADYMRGSIRLSALQELNVAWVFTHDSVAVGEDGPTHQPVEHLLSLRAIPGLTVIRPADATEVAEAWRVILEELDGPAALILSRQDLPILDREKLESARGLARGAYVLREPEGEESASIIATGSEVAVALEAADKLAAAGVHVRVVSMPSWELFDEQDEEIQEDVLPGDLPTVSIEAGVTIGWERYADIPLGIDHFGASAPGGELLERFGITADAVVEAVQELLEEE
ncbi:transketolase [Paraconexibacter algicola]|uniref:Transketolase n=1 Tax=Paraconexibacter algicola TaxID=2133960 RepID=A0A2T4UIK5_9ACTN|nr:transketolase [Paraconexibacter algicola]PTL59068.1 transketolase [Paraconexibacter algicola]